jgi:pimeloyl-ACP methyl ester carboxylesterase
MRARRADAAGFVEHLGVKVHYEVFGDGEPTILLLPTWTLIHKRFWKLQAPYLARHHRVVTYDGPGNGRSDRPAAPAAYEQAAQVAYALAVLDATGTGRAVVVGLSKGANWALALAADYASRVLGTVLIGPGVGLAPFSDTRAQHMAPDAPLPEVAPSQVPLIQPDPASHWAKFNDSYWLEDHADFLWFFLGQCFPEEHSTKAIEDGVGWGLDTTGRVLVADRAAGRPDSGTVRNWCAHIRCPLLLIHGGDDRVVPLANSEIVADLTGGELVVLEGSGHIPLARDPVRVNLLIHDFAERFRPPERRQRT